MNVQNETGSLASVGFDVAEPAPIPVMRVTTPEGAESPLVPLLLSGEIDSRSFNAYAYHLDKIDWSLFGCLTWQSDSCTRRTDVAEKKRQTDFLWWIDSVCGFHHLRHRHLLYYHKAEWGGGRGHYHFLLGRQGTANISTEDLAATMRRFWNKGQADIEPFRPEIHLNGVLYQSKYELGRDGHALVHPENFSPMLTKVLLATANEHTIQTRKERRIEL